MEPLELSHGIVLYVPQLRSFCYQRIGTARGYAREYKQDEEAAHQRCIAKGDDYHWINAQAMVLANDGLTARERFEQRGDKVIEVALGVQVRIEGEVYTLTKHRFGDDCCLSRVDA